MEIEFMAEFTEGMSRDRARKIIKRKRTRRQRPCSPFGMCTTSIETTNNCLIVNCIDQSPVTSSCDTTTKEDEDMANCLIMLAQSVSPVTEENCLTPDQTRNKTERLNTRKFAEINALTIGKPGLYAYECKTCNRTFPSFQALGGHRASHKKPKVNVEVKEMNLDDNLTAKTTQHVEQDEEFNKSVVQEDEENKLVNIITNNVQTGLINNNMKTKVHECSICGSEFLSGQALGGHMRKHRPVPPSSNRTGISLTAAIDDSDGYEIVETSQHKNNGLLSLDLNFPPPEVVEDHRSTFPLTGGSSQQHMVFSSPAFVDCHY